MGNCYAMDESQLFTQLLSSLQETLSFVQNLQDSINSDQVNMCEIKHQWQTAIAHVKFPQAQKEQIEGQLDAIVENLSRYYFNKSLEVYLYKQAIVSKGTDAQLLLKASIEDMMTLKTENAKLKENIDGKCFEQRYCTTQLQSIQSEPKYNLV